MVATVKRTVRIKTQQSILPDVPPSVDNFPMRRWSIQLAILDEHGEELPATLFDKVVYHLHPTFANPNRTFTEPPFKIEEQGWGGFELLISCHLLEKAGERKITHDLHFMKDAYQVDHVIQVPINKPLLRAELEKSGPVDDGAAVSAAAIGENKRKAVTSNGETKAKKVKTAVGSTVKGSVDLEKLAFGLTKLNEDDLVGVVQMVTDNRTPDMNITNNVEEGEFVIDLYSLPEGLLKSLWEYVKKNIE
ncbi:ACR099Cp [Eremothecium gossypii ATCC 10895]|uniref:ACR099Cp n=1 Tax=Eremothecium gossypii (strain ATCC 10895 / CBS 109.51 / FGSC 9923 / NRRL Y-1056) TaxID=284811 RepID=Q75C18_EREGS|nr:ACR099Cp [Eremothecium gossypii ATCC 10895]AAS51325.1 ACR099Cp [Eremothecium gossypii ATCC 10895]AEY95617.1 FACR099Cp [Eremothecium gossypii FDAG1]